MKTTENKSEVANLMRQITQEYESAERGMTGFAQGTSQHAFITARMENIERCRERLMTVVGPDQANRLVVEALEKA